MPRRPQGADATRRPTPALAVNYQRLSTADRGAGRYRGVRNALETNAVSAGRVSLGLSNRVLDLVNEGRIHGDGALTVTLQVT